MNWTGAQFNRDSTKFKFPYLKDLKRQHLRHSYEYLEKTGVEWNVIIAWKFGQI